MLLSPEQILNYAACQNKHSSEEQVFVDKDVTLNPKVAARAAVGVYSGLEPPPALIQYIRTRAMFQPRTPNLLRMLKVDAERWIKARYVHAAPEIQTKWILRAVSDAFDLQPEENRLLETLGYEYGDRLNRATRLAKGERAKHFGWWSKFKWHTMWWIPGMVTRHYKLPTAEVPR